MIPGTSAKSCEYRILKKSGDDNENHQPAGV
jgi:hypothetical protein